MQISDNNISFSALTDYGTSNGLARYVRRRWPTNTLCRVEEEWDLSPGEARGVLYAQASKTTIDKIKRHKRGGWRIVLAVDAEVIGHSLEEFLHSEQKRLADERLRIEQNDRKVVALAGRLSAHGSLCASPVDRCADE